MRNLSPQMMALLERIAANELVTLLEIIGGVVPFRFALNHGFDVVFQGDTYVAQDGAHTEFNQDSLGNRNGLTITLQNQANAETGTGGPFFSQAFQALNLNGARVRFIVVPMELIDVENSAIIEEFWYVSGYDITANRLSLRVASPFDTFYLNIPRRPLVSSTCSWSYREGPCTADPDAPYVDCGKTISDCQARTNWKPTGIEGQPRPLGIGPGYPLYQKNTKRRA